MPDFLPRREDLLLAWSVNFDRIIHADPEKVRLTTAQADAYHARHLSFASAFQAASDPSTRTTSAVQIKRDTKADLLAFARELSRIIRAAPDDTQLVELGLVARKKPVHRIPPPAEAPLVRLQPPDGRKPVLCRAGPDRAVRAPKFSSDTSVTVKLRDAASPSRTAKPRGACSATIYTFVGEQAPASTDQWTFQGSTSKTAFTIDMGPNTPRGSRVWVMARWWSRRGEHGPLSRPAMMRIVGSSPAAAA